MLSSKGSEGRVSETTVTVGPLSESLFAKNRSGFKPTAELRKKPPELGASYTILSPIKNVLPPN